MLSESDSLIVARRAVKAMRTHEYADDETLAKAIATMFRVTSNEGEPPDASIIAKAEKAAAKRQKPTAKQREWGTKSPATAVGQEPIGEPQ